MPRSNENFLACLDCRCGPRHAFFKTSPCPSGRNVRIRKFGCFHGFRIIGTKAQKGELGYISPEKPCPWHTDKPDTDRKVMTFGHAGHLVAYWSAEAWWESWSGDKLEGVHRYPWKWQELPPS